MNVFNRARIGTSPAAKRMEAGALAAGAELVRKREDRQRAAEEAARRAADERQAELAATLNKNASWTARQIEAWARREPDVTVSTVRSRWMSIVQEVAAAHSITVEELISERRTSKLVRSRQEAMCRIFDETPLSYPEIGRRLGGRDHTTILHGVRTHAARHGLPIPRQGGEAA